MEIEKKVQGVFYKICFGILIAIVFFFGSQYVLKLNEIQKDIINLQIKITEIQSQIITRSEVKQIVLQQIRLHK